MGLCERGKHERFEWAIKEREKKGTYPSDFGDFYKWKANPDGLPEPEEEEPSGL